MKQIIIQEIIEQKIFFIRGHRVMVDSDLAHIYGVTTTRLNQQVKRNLSRFPKDFMFQLTRDEFKNLMLQFATSNKGQGGRRKLPYVFTEHGAIMLASVLNTLIAVRSSIQVVRAFVKLREILSTHKELAHKLTELEQKIEKHDTEIKTIFEAIRQLMAPPTKPKRPIGFLGSHDIG
ncbi:MAG: ORF6N domain-containing protein [Elusimicrobia bacterium]|nr:ORF6N domain-containing protein [Elusimicrobiota bacterium]